MRRIHLKLSHRIESNLSKTVPSDFRYHSYIGACFMGGNSLVKSLSSRSHFKNGTLYRLSRYRKTRASCHQIYYKTSKNRCLTHILSSNPQYHSFDLSVPYRTFSLISSVLSSPGYSTPAITSPLIPWIPLAGRLKKAAAGP